MALAAAHKARQFDDIAFPQEAMGKIFPRHDTSVYFRHHSRLPHVKMRQKFT